MSNLINQRLIEEAMDWLPRDVVEAHLDDLEELYRLLKEAKLEGTINVSS